MEDEMVSLTDKRDHLVASIFQLEIEIISNNVQDRLLKNAENQNEKKEIIESILDLSLSRRKLESEILERIALRLERLEPEIQKGIDNLNKAIKQVDTNIDFLSFINALTGVITRVIGLVS